MKRFDKINKSLSELLWFSLVQADVKVRKQSCLCAAEVDLREVDRRIRLGDGWRRVVGAHELQASARYW